MTTVLIGELAALGGALTWAVSGVLLTHINRKVHVVVIGAARGIFASLFFWLLLPFSGGLEALAGISWQTILGLIASVLIVLGLGDSIFFVATKRIGVARAMPLSMTFPLFTMALAAIFLGERVSWLAGGGTVLILLGVYLLSSGPRVAHSPEERRGDILGVVLALGAALCWAIGSVMLTPYSHEVSSVVANCIRQPAGTLLFLAVMPKRMGIRQLRGLSRVEFVELIIGSIVGGGMGALLYMWALRYAGAAISSVLSAASPVFSTPLSIVLLGEKVNARVVIGTLIIIAGIWMVILG